LADGSTAQVPGQYPSLEYDLETVAGQNNTVPQPIYLLPLDTTNQLCVTATTGGGTLTIPDAPGFSLTFGPGQVTFPGGSKTGCVGVTVVHGDKVPMLPGFGQQPRFIVTIQPAGAVFNPPAPITLPNVDGLRPREVTEMYSFDHDIGSFVAIGTGVVSNDGQVIRSSTGVGVLKAGWHCGGNPATTGAAATCKDCQFCNGVSCLFDPSKNCGCCASGTGVCTDGSCNVVDGGQCAVPVPVVPTVKNLGGEPSCGTGSLFGNTVWVRPPPEPTITSCVDGACAWGFRVGAYESTVNAIPCNTPYTQGKADITGAEDPQIYEGNYCDIIQDLTPDATGRPTRDKYWSSAITTQHENFHVEEWRTALAAHWPEFENAVNGLNAPFSCMANSSAAAAASVIRTLDTVLATVLLKANQDWENVGEAPAYADGKASYQNLTAEICIRAIHKGWTQLVSCSVCQ
jgi:hypothetical protein